MCKPRIFIYAFCSEFWEEWVNFGNSSFGRGVKTPENQGLGIGAIYPLLYSLIYSYIVENTFIRRSVCIEGIALTFLSDMTHLGGLGGLGGRRVSFPQVLISGSSQWDFGISSPPGSGCARWRD